MARPSRHDASRNEDLRSGYNRPLVRVADIVWLESAGGMRGGGGDGSRCSGSGSAERGVEDDDNKGTWGP